MKTTLVMAAAVTMLLASALCTADETVNGPQFGDWSTEMEPDPMSPWKSYKSWTDARVIQANSRRGREAWVRLWVTCSAQTEVTGTGRLHRWNAENLREEVETGEAGNRASFVFSDGITTTRFADPHTNDGHQPSVWLQTRLDDKTTQSMGYDFTLNRGRFREGHPSSHGVDPEKKAREEAWREAQPEADYGTPEYKAWEDEWLRLMDEAIQERSTIPKVGLDDLKHHRRLRIKVGLRPEKEEEETKNYNTPSDETVVFEFSLMGATKAMNWTRQGCLETRANALGRYDRAQGLVDSSIDPMSD